MYIANLLELNTDPGILGPLKKNSNSPPVGKKAKNPEEQVCIIHTPLQLMAGWQPTILFCHVPASSDSPKARTGVFHPPASCRYDTLISPLFRRPAEIALALWRRRPRDRVVSRSSKAQPLQRLAPSFSELCVPYFLADHSSALSRPGHKSRGGGGGGNGPQAGFFETMEGGECCAVPSRSHTLLLCLSGCLGSHLCIPAKEVSCASCEVCY